mmetsp:Transcript_4156/g.8547  ORF Transcript_4156/g.8547 Transcript_4156/m.8547 type:complete len:201 (-) Transcript_4156:384-986(-)
MLALASKRTRLAWGFLTCYLCLPLLHAAEIPESVATLDYEPVTVFPNRQARNPCSLVGVREGGPLRNNCKLRSLLGTGERGWNQVRFGERNCTISLKNCVSDLCYSTRDVTFLIEQDPIPRPLPSSIFSNVEILSGADSLKFTKDGFSFKPTGSSVDLRYSTYTCGEFYAYRGRVEEQLCREPIEVLTALDYGLATDVLC